MPLTPFDVTDRGPSQARVISTPCEDGGPKSVAATSVVRLTRDEENERHHSVTPAK